MDSDGLAANARGTLCLDGNTVIAPDVLRAAEAFMAEVRRVQRESQRDLRGPARLADDVTRSLKSASAESTLIRAVSDGSPDAVMTKALEGFEEMCRRRGQDVPPRLRGAIYRLLASELEVNARMLQSSVADVARATIYNGELSSLTRDAEFASLHNTPAVFVRAAVNYPSDPKAFLRKVIATVSELERDPEFESFGDTPSVFVRAAVNYPSDPKAFLRKVIATIPELESDPEFASLQQDTPWVLRQAAIGNPSDPKGFLRKVIATVAELESDPEFASLDDTPWALRHAAVNYPSDPKGFLRKVISTVAELERDPEFASLQRDTPGALRRAAISYPADPKGFLRKMIVTVAESEHDPELASSGATPGMIRHDVIRRPSDPRGLLRQMSQQAVTSEGASREGASWSDALLAQDTPGDGGRAR